MFFHAVTNSVFEKAYIEAVGRALCIAQNFETNCRSLAILLDVKTARGNIAHEDEFKKLIEKLSKRMLRGAIQQLGKHLPLPENLEQILEKATDARNYIAHDSMKIFFNPAGIEDRLAVNLVVLRDAVRNIADADGMVAAWCVGVSYGQCMSRISYAEDIERWVFSEFTSEDFEVVD